MNEDHSVLYHDRIVIIVRSYPRGVFVSLPFLFFCSLKCCHPLAMLHPYRFGPMLGWVSVMQSCRVRNLPYILAGWGFFVVNLFAHKKGENNIV